MFQPYAVPVYAGFWYRFLAYILDGLISACIFFPLGLILGLAMVASGEDPDSPPMLMIRLGVNALSVMATWLYYAICESSSWQGTVGKKILGLRVTDMDGRAIGFGKATGRHFGKMISGLILGIGFIMIAFTERKQGLHDLMANTLVLRGGMPQDYPMPPSPPDFGYRGGSLGLG
jgi:uncharacterized RDD family membrane protein YckC